MRTMKWTPVIAIMVIIALAITLSYVGCGGSSSSSSGSSAATLQLGSVVSAKGMFTFNQTIAATDEADGNGFSAPFSAQANYWDLDQDLSLADGADDQFDTALLLTVSGTDFAMDQTYNELTWMSPALGTADGIIAAAAVTRTYGSSGIKTAISGTYSAFLNNISDARLKQTINLTSATTPITLTWSYDYEISSGEISTTNTGYFKLVIRNTAGTELETIYSDVVTDTATSDSATAITASLTAYAGQSIVLSFEARYSRYDWDGTNCLIDDISVKGNNGTEYVTNGDFETGNLNGWTTNSPVEYQNITSGSRNITDTLDADMNLTVTRSFFTRPNKLWGRWVDVFENNTVTATTVTITYHTNLGNDSHGIIYTPSGSSNHALVSWDGSGDDRDLGMVFGNAVSLTYLSATTIGGSDGDDDIYFYYPITVPANSRVSIVNFIVMNGINTGMTASAITAKATAIDTEVLRILNNFWSDVQYREGMTQKQIDAVLNFPH